MRELTEYAMCACSLLPLFANLSSKKYLIFAVLFTKHRGCISGTVNQYNFFCVGRGGDKRNVGWEPDMC